MYPLVILFLQNSYHPVIYFYQISMCLVNSLLEKIICPVIFFDKSNCVVIFFDWEKYPHIPVDPKSSVPPPRRRQCWTHTPRGGRVRRLCSSIVFLCTSVPVLQCTSEIQIFGPSIIRTLWLSDPRIIRYPTLIRPFNFQTPFSENKIWNIQFARMQFWGVLKKFRTRINRHPKWWCFLQTL